MNQIVIFDFETTGIDTDTADPIELGAIRYDLATGMEMGQQSSFISLPRGVKLPDETTDLTGITEKDLRGAPLAKHVIRAFLDFVKNDPLMAYNAFYDVCVLRRQLRLHNLRWPDLLVYDALQMSYLHCGGEKSHRLQALAKKFKVDTANSHRAIDDSQTLFKVYSRMCRDLSVSLPDGLKLLNPCRLRSNYIENVDSMAYAWYPGAQNA